MRNREWFRCQLVRRGVLCVVTFSFLVVAAPNAEAVPNEDRYRPSKWSPTDFVTLMQSNAAWGDAAYWWKWLAPNNTSSSLYNPGIQGTLELGAA